MGSNSDCRRCFSILSTIISVVLSIADIITDIVQAVQFYKKGDIVWGTLTVVFIAFPVFVYLVLVIYMASCVKDKCEKRLLVIPAFFCVPFLVLNNFLGMVLYAWYVLKNEPTDKKDKYYYRMATYSQVLEALLESAPQCVLQIYIILVDESITSVGDISVTSLLSITTSVAMFTWSFVSYEKMIYYANNAEDMTVPAKLFLFFVKFSECFQRVLAVALLLSLLRLRVPNDIFLFISFVILLVHFLFLTATDMRTQETCDIKTVCNCLYASILRAICYTSTNGVDNSVNRFKLHYLLVNFENIAILVTWRFLTPDTEKWLFNYVLGIFIVLFVFQIIFLALYHSSTGEYKTAGKSSFKMSDEYFKYIACPCCTYCDENP